MKEKEFFAQGVNVDPLRSLLSISILQERLSRVLLDHIKPGMPVLIDENRQISDKHLVELAKLGD